MREIHISVINLEWDKLYPIELGQPSLQVGQVKELLRMENDVFRTQNQIMLYNGMKCSDEMLLSDIVSYIFTIMSGSGSLYLYLRASNHAVRYSLFAGRRGRAMH
jgi:hypothetical protein